MSRSSAPDRRKYGPPLVRWFAQAGRDLPWRSAGPRDPYRVWISEAMLQQTRVATVIDYYGRFVRRFPDVHSLAKASEEEVLQHGLLLKNVITGIRDIRNKQQIKPKETIELYIQTGEKAVYKKIESVLAKQTNAEKLSYTEDSIASAITTVIGKDKFFS